MQLPLTSTDPNSGGTTHLWVWRANCAYRKIHVWWCSRVSCIQALLIFLIYLSRPPVHLEPLTNRGPKYFLFKILDLFPKLPVLTAGSVFQPTFHQSLPQVQLPVLPWPLHCPSGHSRLPEALRMELVTPACSFLFCSSLQAGSWH